MHQSEVALQGVHVMLFVKLMELLHDYTTRTVDLNKDADKKQLAEYLEKHLSEFLLEAVKIRLRRKSNELF